MNIEITINDITVKGSFISVKDASEFVNSVLENIREKYKVLSPIKDFGNPIRDFGIAFPSTPMWKIGDMENHYPNITCSHDKIKDFKNKDKDVK